VYSPLVRNGCGPGKKVGIVGVGGLGHYAVQFAKALGAEKVVVFSHSDRKEKDVREMGADEFVTTGNSDFQKKWQGELDLVICTADVSSGIPLNELISTLTVHGRFIIVAMPDDALPEIKSQTLASNGVLIGGSHIGSKKEAIEMLKLAAEKGVKSWVEELPMKECGKAVENVKDGKARYRYVLIGDL